MSRALMTGITGLRTHQQKLDVVANNLANMNTIGFKSQAAIFSDLVYNVDRGGSASSDTAGGINPQAIGTGVQTAQITRNFSPGTLETTSGEFDFAIQGDGFFTVMSPTGEPHYTRAGAFALDDRGRLVDPATGYLVQRIGNLGEAADGGVRFQTEGDDTIFIPIGSAIPGTQTANIDFTGNLPSTSSPPQAEILSSFRGFEDSGGAATGATLLNDLTINTTPYVPGDMFELVGTNPDGSTFTVALPADTSTMQDIVDTLNANLVDAVASLQADGTLVVTADDTGEAFLSLTLRDVAGNTGETNFSGNSMFISTEGTDGDSFDVSMDMFDERGESHRMTFTFTKDTINNWSVSASIPSSSGTMIDDSVLNLTFNENGSYAIAGINGIGDANIEVQINGITNPQTIELDFSKISHLASDFLMTQTQDGIPPGALSSVAVSTSGELTGLASNGRALPLAQLAIASFPNSSALEAVGANYFQQSISSGDAALGLGATGSRGQIMGGQLERSNVDIALEFTQLIVAQRGFSANARTITVSDEMLEELTNIIR
ncbi:flagellar hook-basal body complex protein [Stieleria sp. JC731]|uniref:flagellar hook protein FlgE n=1 Tax=Pirellulaceae TaxID=2691357 RepID=UPI001E3B3889|nr:flagellar hook-basal body complex protein [Stieleria sp. JC731]MCC9602051.1 flagellar hook-basal body complex protein [Stieleria sp. JC731]